MHAQCSGGARGGGAELLQEVVLVWQRVWVVREEDTPWEHNVEEGFLCRSAFEGCQVGGGEHSEREGGGRREGSVGSGWVWRQKMLNAAKASEACKAHLELWIYQNS